MRRPGLKVLFLGLPEMEHYTAGVGELMSPSVTVSEVVERAKAILGANGEIDRQLHADELSTA